MYLGWYFGKVMVILDKSFFKIFLVEVKEKEECDCLIC